MEKFKLTKNERNWVLYDVANSAYIMILTALIPIYYNLVASDLGKDANEITTLFGTTLSVAAIVVGVLSPILGAIADNKGVKKKMYFIFMLLGVASCFLFALTGESLLLIAAVMVLGKVGFNGSIVFYDAMLVDVTEQNRMDDVSARGYGWGYIGSCIPFVISLALYILSTMEIGGKLIIGLGAGWAIRVGMIITGIWWLVFSLPLYKTYEQRFGVEPVKHQVRDAFKKIGATFKNIKQYKAPFLFVVAFFFYINGVTTIIGMSVTYAQNVLGNGAINAIMLVLALLMTQFVAWPSAIIYGKLSNKYSPRTLILIAIGGYFCIAIYGIFLHTIVDFFILAFFVGLFQGGIQALSRSYFAKLVPKEKANEFFGIFDISSKGAAILGPAVMAGATAAFNSAQVGIGVLTVFFLIGGIILIKLPKNAGDVPNGQIEEEKQEDEEEIS